MEITFKLSVKQYLAGLSCVLFAGFYMVGEQTVEKYSGFVHVKMGGTLLLDPWSIDYKRMFLNL